MNGIGNNGERIQTVLQQFAVDYLFVLAHPTVQILLTSHTHTHKSLIIYSIGILELSPLATGHTRSMTFFVVSLNETILNFVH